MSSQLAVVIAIDVSAALKSGNLSENIYLIDNHKFRGSRNQGTSDLITVVEGSQIVNWLASDINLTETNIVPVIESISGEAVEKQVMVPQQFQSPELGDGLGLWWGATVDANAEGIYPYTINFDFNGTKMSIVSYVDVRQGFSNATDSEAEGNRRRRSTSSDYKTLFRR